LVELVARNLAFYVSREEYIHSIHISDDVYQW
jgi:hypothetical protein